MAEAPKRVLVTGAGSGIGLATTLKLAGNGFRVIGLVQDDSQYRLLSGQAAELGVDIHLLQADLSRPGQREGIASDLDLWGLVNNAAYMNAGQLQDVPLDDARAQLETMVLAPMDLALQALPGMLARGEGRIINLNTGGIHFSTPLTGWYLAAKAALHELTDALRVELRGSGVMVLDIEPGGVRTPIWDRARREMEQRSRASDRPELYRMVLRNLDKYERHMSEPEHIAGAVLSMLTRRHPPPHKRVGRGALFMRLSGDLVPDRLWDWLAERVINRA